MRLIDADALFKDICDSINEMTKIGICVDGEWFWAKLNDALENAPTIEPKQRWIPCSEKTHPDLPVRVQVQMTNGWIITAYYQDGDWLSVPNYGDVIRDEWIEAWRELPEPYREEGEQECQN